MIRLNLPAFKINLAGTQQHPAIFDILRRKYVALTPEEWVRQHFIHFLIEQKGYPKTLLVNEVQLRIGEKSVRADSVLYDTDLHPQLTQRVFDQISVYNMLLHVDYLIVSNGLQHYCCKMDYEHNTYTFVPEIPTYNEI